MLFRLVHVFKVYFVNDDQFLLACYYNYPTFNAEYLHFLANKNFSKTFHFSFCD